MTLAVFFPELVINWIENVGDMIFLLFLVIAGNVDRDHLQWNRNQKFPRHPVLGDIIESYKDDRAKYSLLQSLIIRSLIEHFQTTLNG